jgi:hypothetical protein
LDTMIPTRVNSLSSFRFSLILIATAAITKRSLAVSHPKLFYYSI